MAKVTVTIEGEINEVILALRGMAGRIPIADDASSDGVRANISVNGEVTEDIPANAPASGGVPDSPAAVESAAIWNSSYVHTFWRNLSDTARQAMLRVSRSPNHTQKRAQLMHTLQLSQRELSGSLSSQGHSLNRLKKRRGDVNLPRPLTYDKTDDAYVLDSDFANALQEIGLN